MVIKGGTISLADMGDPNASIPTLEPVFFFTIYIPKSNYLLENVFRKSEMMRMFLHFVQVKMRPMFGAFGKAASSNSIAFISKVWE